MMKKAKKVCIAFVMALLLVFPAACNKKESGGEGATVAEIVSVFGQQTEFDLGSGFGYDGITITVKYSDGSIGTLDDSAYTVTCPAYNADAAGEYTAKVTVNGASLYHYYTVRVTARSGETPQTTELFAYNDLPELFSESTLFYEPAVGVDSEWKGRYTTWVYPAEGGFEDAQEVGMIAAYSQMHGAQAGFSTVGQFDFNGTVVVRVRTSFDFDEVVIRPLSYGITAERPGGTERTVEFTLEKPCNISVEFDGDICKNLQIFSSYIGKYSKESDRLIEELRSDADKNVIAFEGNGENYVDLDVKDISAGLSKTKHNVIVFGAGVFRLCTNDAYPGGGYFDLPSGTELVIHGDAAVMTHVKICDASGVVICGRGFLSGQVAEALNCIFALRTAGLTVQGIVTWNSNNWTNEIEECRNVVFRDVKIAGQRRNNNDGIDICSSSDVLIDGCYIHTIDDCITLKARFADYSTRAWVENIAVQNCVIWNYQGGNGIVVGSETCSDRYNNLTFRNIDIIHNDCGNAVSMEIIDSARVTNVVFDDIRMDLGGKWKPDVTTYEYNSDAANRQSLIRMDIMPNDSAFYSTDTNDGAIDGVVFSGLKYTGGSRLIEYKGSGANSIRNVSFYGFDYNGNILTNENCETFKSPYSKNYENVEYLADRFYEETDESGYLFDDADLDFGDAPARKIADGRFVGGGYTAIDVPLGGSVSVYANVTQEGYFMPYVYLIQNGIGGAFDVFLDGVNAGTADTCSFTSEYTKFYLPMTYFSCGTHELKFVAKDDSVRETGHILSLSVNAMMLVNSGSNYFEAEALSGGKVVKECAASGGEAVMFNGGAEGELLLTGTNPAEREAELILTYCAGPDKGRYRFYLDGEPISSDIDMYCKTYVYRTAELSVISLPRGSFTLRAECSGKNLRSTGYGAVIDCFELRHIPVGKTYKSEPGCATASSGVGIGIEGQMQPMYFTNIRRGDDIRINHWNVPMSYLYRFEIYAEGFDASAFEIYFGGKKREFSYSDGVISFTTPIKYMGDECVKFVCNGEGVYAFSVTKYVMTPVKTEKGGLRDAVLAARATDLSSFSESGRAYYRNALVHAESVLFDCTKTPEETAEAEHVLKNLKAEFFGGEAEYTAIANAASSVSVSFRNADGKLAVMHVNSDGGDELLYAVVENGAAVFDTSGYAGKKVKVIAFLEDFSSPPEFSVGTGETGEFTFDRTFSEAQLQTAVKFERAGNATQLFARFANYEMGETVGVSVRSSENKVLFGLEGEIAFDGFAVFDLPSESMRDTVYFIFSVGHEAVLKDAYLPNVLLADVDLGMLLAGSDPVEGLSVSGGADGEGQMSFPAQGGYQTSTVSFEYDRVFTKAVFELFIVSECESGGPDVVVLQDKYGLNMGFQATAGNNVFEIGYEECGGRIKLSVRIGCCGDWGICQGEHPHGDESVDFGNLKIYGNISGEFIALRSI